MTAREIAIAQDYEAITPESLRRPVRVIRERFIGLAKGQRARHRMMFLRQISIHPAIEPHAFSQQFALFEGDLSKCVKEAFDRFLQMALANSRVVKVPAIDWATQQVESLVISECDALPGWIVSICEPEPSFASWRAPKWLTWAFQSPSRNEYDPQRAWVREDEHTTSRVLKAVTESHERALRTKLNDAADEAAVRLACAPPEDNWKGISATPQSRGVRKAKSTLEIRRAGIVFSALQLNLKGIKYCAFLDECKMKPLEKWQSDGFPATYVLGYRQERWRKKIHDEKHRFQIQYDSKSAQERERVIRGVLGSTRATR